MTSSADWISVLANGIPISPDTLSYSHTHAFKANPVFGMNVGVEQYAVGQFDPQATLGGYINSAPTAKSAHNLLSTIGVGANDVEALTLAMYGQNAVATTGDAATIAGFTLGDYKYKIDPNTPLQFNAPFKGRGRFATLARVIANYNAIGSGYSATFWDRGANAASGTTLGAAALLQVYNPTGTAATGNVTVPSLPAAADTVSFNGTTYTWRAAPAVANDILIGATALASANNLYEALTGGTGISGAYFAGTAKGPVTASYSQPSGASNTITITFLTTGTGGNAYTLAKTGTGGLTVSGATLTGGLAGDTYTFTVQTCTTSGGAYVVAGTFTSLGATQQAEWLTIAPVVTLNRFVKFVATPVSGSSNTIGFACAFAPMWNL